MASLLRTHSCRYFLFAALFSCLLLAHGAGGADGDWSYELSVAQQQAVAAISADSLRGHLSFIASDLLQGRGNGSAGESLAAEYVAAQFRRAGLKPVGDDGYFQTAPRIEISPVMDGYRCRILADGQTMDIPANRFAATDLSNNRALLRELRIEGVAVVKVPFGGNAPGLAADLRGKVILTEYPSGTQDRTLLSRRQEFLARMAALHPDLIVEIRRGVTRDSTYFSSRILVDADQRENQSPGIPLASLSDESVIQFYDALPEGPGKAMFHLTLSKPAEKKIVLRNVVGLLPGSDPKLADQYILLTAHYDGVGLRGGAETGWNGANDNGSGTVSVVEVASALATLKERPRRSLVFMVFHGEEVGGLGSRFYAQHPIFPIEKTIADVNLEQVGRTDSSEGDQSKRASLTGYDYSDMGEIFRRAGEIAGVSVYKHEKNSDPYFSASDNAVLANLGIPAHTLCVAFSFADYHGAGDTWQKVDYDNMALTDKLIATALLILAQSDREPRWHADAPQASRYLAAWKKNHDQGK